jgi:hypothetical protein
MISIDPSYYQRFSETLNEEKNKRLAHEFLRDIVSFKKSLQEEMQAMMVADKKGKPLDKELFSIMVMVQEKYLHVMHALREDETRARHALTVFADAVQDLMTHMHRQRKQ